MLKITATVRDRGGYFFLFLPLSLSEMSFAIPITRVMQLAEKSHLGRLFCKVTPFLAVMPQKIKIGQSKALPRFLGYDRDLGSHKDV